MIGIVTEPSAALLAYEIGVDETEVSNVLVVRLGGLTADLTIISVRNGLYSVVDSVHLPHLGGNIITQVLSEYLAQEFFGKYKLDPRESRRTMIKLNESAENVKHILSAMPSAHVFIESLIDGIDFQSSISRARFENVIASKLSGIIRSIEEFIAKANVDIDKVRTHTHTHMLMRLFLSPFADKQNTNRPDNHKNSDQNFTVSCIFLASQTDCMRRRYDENP